MINKGSDEIIMCSVLMSIRPEFVRQIMTGKKKYEYRKRVCRNKIDRIYIYSTVPVRKIVGEAEIESVLVNTPEKLWEITKDAAGIDKEFYDSYFGDREEAVAYKLINIKSYENPKTLKDFGISVAPQSYQYIDF